ncbi:glycoside hydrolase family 30 beta sandwich domain-containing protein [Bacillus sp. USDA818B3_A]|uniref:glycoside hydrolase family 30 beta sandwich domain-containing protein n=1 Tax=Bacillus sp. USDA818B3_A TaxID=2698834 RepID=UPI001F3F5BA0|nr:glycoside hydrolase family 30 beta sandwich domain-containing protein [Bacillus sp. USDA818B3_A]
MKGLVAVSMNWECIISSMEQMGMFTGMQYWKRKDAALGAWKQNSMITVDPVTKKFTYNPEFYVVKHHSHFVKNGAVRIETKGHLTAHSLAFQNPDGSTVLIVNNPLKKQRELVFEFQGKSFQCELKAESFNTMVLK